MLFNLYEFLIILSYYTFGIGIKTQWISEIASNLITEPPTYEYMAWIPPKSLFINKMYSYTY